MGPDTPRPKDHGADLVRRDAFRGAMLQGGNEHRALGCGMPQPIVSSGRQQACVLGGLDLRGAQHAVPVGVHLGEDLRMI